MDVYDVGGRANHYRRMTALQPHEIIMPLYSRYSNTQLASITRLFRSVSDKNMGTSFATVIADHPALKPYIPALIAVRKSVIGEV